MAAKKTAKQPTEGAAVETPEQPVERTEESAAVEPESAQVEAPQADEPTAVEPPVDITARGEEKAATAVIAGALADAEATAAQDAADFDEWQEEGESIARALEVVRPLPQKTRRCPAHPRFFPTEDATRPISEFRFRKDGKLASTYCRRCDGKMHTEYSRRKRAEAKQSPGMKSPEELEAFNFAEVVEQVRSLIGTGAAPIEAVDLIIGAIEESLTTLREELEIRFGLEPGSSDHATDDLEGHEASLIEQQMQAPKADDHE